MREKEQIQVTVGLDDLSSLKTKADTHDVYCQLYNDKTKEVNKLMSEIAGLKLELKAEVDAFSDKNKECEELKQKLDEIEAVCEAQAKRLEKVGQ